MTPSLPYLSAKRLATTKRKVANYTSFPFPFGRISDGLDVDDDPPPPTSDEQFSTSSSLLPFFLSHRTETIGLAHTRRAGLKLSRRGGSWRKSEKGRTTSFDVESASSRSLLRARLTREAVRSINWTNGTIIRCARSFYDIPGCLPSP